MSNNSFAKFLEHFAKDRSPYELLRLFNDIFNDGNTFALAQKYNITKYDIRFIRQFPGDCVLYVLEIQQRLGVYYGENKNDKTMQEVSNYA